MKLSNIFLPTQCLILTWLFVHLGKRDAEVDPDIKNNSKKQKKELVKAEKKAPPPKKVETSTSSDSEEEVKRYNFNSLDL